MVELNKIRVAAYCRSSSLIKEEEDLLNNEIEHYKNVIKSNIAWQLVGIYSDRDNSGNRPGFQKMIRDAVAGEIDLILCQSISRFGSNMIDTMNTVKYLVKHGVKIIFEKENIDTDDKQSQTILSQFYATAHEESRNISDSTRWAMTKKFERGEPVFIRMLGYRLEEKEWRIIPEEAEVVKEAFKLYIAGQTPLQIARRFIQKGYAKSNGRTDWSAIAVRDILMNERYTGDALCRKSKAHKSLKSESSADKSVEKQYLIKNHHEPIVSHETYQQAKIMLEQVTKGECLGAKKTYSLSGRLRCNSCGSNFQRYICRGVVTWRCPTHTKSKKLCSMIGIREELIIKAMRKGFIEYYELFNDNNSGKQELIKLKNDLQNVKGIGEDKLKQLRMEFQVLLLKENKTILQGDEAVDRSSELEDLKKQREEKEKQISQFENWLLLLDEDNQYRKKAIKELEELQNMKEPLIELKNHMNEISFLRAWAVEIIALSPLSFAITWNNGITTIIEMEEGEQYE
jgi:site-specific DNA recombinase